MIKKMYFLSLFVIFMIVVSLTDNVFAKRKDNCEFGYYFTGRRCLKCGLTTIDPLVRFDGIKPALKNSWPFHAYIQQLNENGETRKVCGGTLINRRTVLTSANCIAGNEFVTSDKYPSLESSFKVQFGYYKEANYEETLEFGVSKLIKHPRYGVDENENYDIGLIILSTPLKDITGISVACLPDTTDNLPVINQTALLVGWQTLDTSEKTESLVNGDVSILNSNLCYTNPETKTADYLRSELCAGHYEGGRDSCYGDIGGGLYVQEPYDGIDVYVVAGIANVNEGCKTSLTNYNGKYTKVSHYTKWIKSNSIY